MEGKRRGEGIKKRAAQLDAEVVFMRRRLVNYNNQENKNNQ